MTENIPFRLPSFGLRPKMLYVIPFRGKNLYRKKNLLITIQWFKNVKKYLLQNYELEIDLCVIEQDREPCGIVPKEDIESIFVVNDGTFNQGWSYNVVVKQKPNYQYYIFSNADIIVPDYETFCDQLTDHCVVNPKPAFRPFNDRLNFSMSDCQTINTCDDAIKTYHNIRAKLLKHEGLSFASNMIVMSSEIYEQIGGWDEMFRGWGRFDDFITHKLTFLCQCQAIYSPVVAVHLWHPITNEYILGPDNVKLYEKYIKYSKVDLLNLIENNRQTMGNPDLYLRK
jgi:hypothetical protein